MVKVDEYGFEGAAYTKFNLAPMGMPARPDRKVTVRLDRPFIFTVKEGRNCLFIGVMRRYENR